MNIERDKFLTEAMGECWHTPVWTERKECYTHCFDCGEKFEEISDYDCNIHFSTWEGFGKLWTWAQSQGWWQHFLIWTAFTQQYVDAQQRWVWYFVNPDRFATSVCQYLKDRA